MTAEAIARELHGRRSGAGWVARCPSHDDREPSLSIAERGGKILVKCHAGCEQAAVVAALKAVGLWPEAERREFPPAWGTLTHTYTYTDARGEPLYQVCRFEPKTFRPRYPDGRGGWIWRKHPNQVLYHLREVLEAPIVFLVEGEKDVETLRDWGFVATTAAGGAAAPWLPQFTVALRGREVIVIPDSDPAGRRRGAAVAKALLHNVARLIIWMPDDAKDVTEWFERGHSELELIAQVEGEAVPR